MIACTLSAEGHHGSASPEAAAASASAMPSRSISSSRSAASSQSTACRSSWSMKERALANARMLVAMTPSPSCQCPECSNGKPLRRGLDRQPRPLERCRQIEEAHRADDDGNSQDEVSQQLVGRRVAGGSAMLAPAPPVVGELPVEVCVLEAGERRRQRAAGLRAGLDDGAEHVAAQPLRHRPRPQPAAHRLAPADPKGGDEAQRQRDGLQALDDELRPSRRPSVDGQQHQRTDDGARPWWPRVPFGPGAGRYAAP